MGTEYNRADMLPTEDAAKVRELLRTYINQRILFYLNNENGMSEVNTAKLQTEPWSSVVRVATAQPTPVVPLRFLE